MTLLFTPLRLGGCTLRNRVWVSPMCQYSAVEGVLTDWHFVHLGSLATGGAGLIVAESTGVTPDGRISPYCAGIWTDVQAESWARVVRFVHEHGTSIGLQLAHSGRKGSTSPPWTGERAISPEAGGWPTLAPSAIPYGDLPAPREMTGVDIREIRDAFAAAAVRALAAGFDLVEIHVAHGYLLHEFLSPITNRRTDAYGGSDEACMRFPLEVIAAVRDVWPANRPLLVRISTRSWTDDPDEVERSIEFARRLADAGVDLVDCSSGGLLPEAANPETGDYQSALAGQVRRATGIPTAAVGRITTPAQAERILTNGDADAVFLGRAMLRNPRWALAAAADLGEDVAWPVQYERARNVASMAESAT